MPIRLGIQLASKSDDPRPPPPSPITPQTELKQVCPWQLAQGLQKSGLDAQELSNVTRDPAHTMSPKHLTPAAGDASSCKGHDHEVHGKR